ncbi:SOS response-associated peptidase [Edaphobacter modestus]|uniref:Abasic site processing protein n=1 Tax=Edaphobacter modestus TaxID=388466 RepID=A0A4Q7YTQ6_9BACT|nr:SOS response-associated peptidase [Edaphobacter modestus]RZU40329.1 putative SOS response-associated peptidase YedK [Edaphobacter modestus]
MCGRYYRKSDKQKIAEAFHVAQVDDFPLPPDDYNIAPSTMQPVIRANRDTGERELVQLRWGLVPFSTKNLADLKGKSTINARAESITRGWWAQPFKKRRCLVPASGFYEWTHDDPKNKRPFAFDLAKGKPMAFAGLWDAWKNPADGSWLQTYTIITTDANELMTIVKWNKA